MAAGTTYKKEVHIDNRELDERLCNDLMRYDLILLQAPIGWGKHTFLMGFAEHHPEFSIQMLEEGHAAEQLQSLPEEDGQIFIITDLNEILPEESDREHLWKRIGKKSHGEKYVIPCSRTAHYLWNQGNETEQGRSAPVFRKKGNLSE